MTNSLNCFALQEPRLIPQRSQGWQRWQNLALPIVPSIATSPKSAPTLDLPAVTARLDVTALLALSIVSAIATHHATALAVKVPAAPLDIYVLLNLLADPGHVHILEIALLALTNYPTTTARLSLLADPSNVLTLVEIALLSLVADLDDARILALTHRLEAIGAHLATPGLLYVAHLSELVAISSTAALLIGTTLLSFATQIHVDQLEPTVQWPLLHSMGLTIAVSPP